MAPTLEMALVSPAVWQPQQDQAFAELNERQRRFALAVLSSMHNRHVGATPSLIAALIPALLDPAVRLEEDNPWQAVFARLLGGLDPDARVPAGTRRRRALFGMVLSTNPMYCVTRIATPLIERACRELGRCYLFCEDAAGTDVNAHQYTGYGRDLTKRLRQFALDPAHELFWREHAAALASFSRRFAQPSAAGATLPEVDPIALALLLRARTPPAEVRPRARRHRQVTTSLLHRDKRHKREGGIDGIQLTRRIEDLDGILLSEYIYPEIIRDDRLLNTGFFAVQRRPRREKLRDVLLAALLPASHDFRLEADFLKACWFELCAKLGFHLRGQGLLRSEFRWCEGGPEGHAHGDAFLLQSMVGMLPAGELGTPAGFRDEFLAALGWLPSFLDTRDRPRPLETTAPPLPSSRLPADQQFATLVTWASATWRDQREQSHWQENQDTGPADQRLALDRFAVVHLMLLLPAHARPLESFSLSSLRADLGIGLKPGQNLSVTWVPAALHSGPDWIFDARGKAGTSLFSSSERNFDGPKISARLVTTWLAQLTREIWHV